MEERLYLDHAATSAPKPAAVAARLERYFREEALSAGRGSYRRAELIGREIAAARGALAVLIGAETPDRVVFTGSGTESLNLALLGLLQSGDHVITTDLEHNSVLRPLAWLQTKGTIEVTSIPPESDGRVAAERFAQAIRPNTRLISCVHASNVLGTVQPIAEICQLARERGIFTLIDAAQSLGHLPLNVTAWGCDLLAGPAHKGLLAPLGVGLLYLRKGMEQHVQPLLRGGTGTHSELAEQPAQLPSRYESGSLNVPGLLGLSAALETVTPLFVEQEALRLQTLTSRLIAELQQIPQLTIYAADVPPEQRLAVISVNLSGQDPRIVETLLDAHFGIEVRSGFHCAPRAHAWLGTDKQGGTVRLSLGHTTREEDLDRIVTVFRELSAVSF